MQPDEDDEVAQRLAAIPREEFPEDVKRAILQDVWRQNATRSGARRHAMRRSWLPLTWAAAAAVIIAIVMVGRPYLRDTSATMAPGATLRVERQGNHYALEPAIAGPRPIEVVVAWDPNQVDFIGFSDQKDASFGKSQVRITLRDPSQRVRVIVRPRNGVTAAQFRVSAGGEEILRTVVPFQ